MYEEMSGNFSSPYYPSAYIENDEEEYLFIAPENHIIQFSFPTPLDMEYSDNCKFDRLEIRDGRFGFSPLLGRFCGSGRPRSFRTTGRYAWAYFLADTMIHGNGFHAFYEFIENDQSVSELQEPDCVFSLYEKDGIISSSEVHTLYNMTGFPIEADGELECVWEIFLPDFYKILFKFDVFNLRRPHSCTDNSITLYERVSSDDISYQRVQYCSTSAPYVAMITNLAYVRFKAKGVGRRSSFRIIYTAYRDAPCNETLTFPCDDEICLDKELACNGIVDCLKLPRDEQNCDAAQSKHFFEKVDTMLGCMIGVISVVIVITLCFVCRHSVLKTRKKAVLREKERKTNEQNFRNTSFLMDTDEDPIPGSRSRHQQGDYFALTSNPVSNGIQTVQSAFTYETMNGDPIPRDNNLTTMKKKIPNKSTHQVQLHGSDKPPRYETLTYEPPI
ncbi:neuropilin and tolloid-like protein 2 isoform X2 [Anneissia japonica]|uniref:neuropilin and tolloid-like protein 2 isoform X2 n=1 Tax=Anneissia japonica TaxID=1529436 RepID=UPI001425A0E2|nr:neuropilin and tolloid-like protein 2 isoform X2 [Anneissia japonica]